MITKIELVAMLMVILFGATSFMQTFSLPKSIERGKEAYISNCQNCHMADGAGMTGAYPPLAKADYLKKSTNELLGIVLNGQSGEIKVNGVAYNAIMPAQNYLTDEQIADIYNYVRNSWGNKNSVAITPALVAKTRAQTK